MCQDIHEPLECPFFEISCLIDTVMKAEVKKQSTTREYWFKEGCYISEVANDARDEYLSIARARVEPETTTAWYKLTGVTERYVIISGRGRVEIGEDKCVDVQTGDVVRIPSWDGPENIKHWRG